jgi:hypothetical protein
LASRATQRDIGLEAHIQREMPFFLTLRDGEGNALSSAMLPPGGKHRDGFRIIIVAVSNTDPYREQEPPSLRWGCISISNLIATAASPMSTKDVDRYCYFIERCQLLYAAKSQRIDASGCPCPMRSTKRRYSSRLQIRPRALSDFTCSNGQLVEEQRASPPPIALATDPSQLDPMSITYSGGPANIVEHVFSK